MKIILVDHHSWGESQVLLFDTLFPKFRNFCKREKLLEGASEGKSQEGCCEEGLREHCLGPRCAQEQEYGVELQGHA
jgi:hypothetical protein